MSAPEQAAADWRPRRVHVFAPDGERTQRVRERLERMLETAGLARASAPAGPDDLVLSLGGDGTLLEALRRYRGVDPVFCGINTGSLGFLQEIDEDNLVPSLDRILNGPLRVYRHRLLEIQVLAGDEALRSYQAFNDAVIERRDTRTLRMTLRIDDHDLGPLVADGLLVSTAEGSTAYAFAADGAVIHPGCRAMQVVALHAHRSRLARAIDAPLIVPRGAVVEVTVDWSQCRRPRLVVDGEQGALGRGERIRVGESRQSVRLLRLGLTDFWERLRDKF